MIFFQTSRNIPTDYKASFKLNKDLYNIHSLRILAILIIGISLILVLQNIYLPSVPVTDIWHNLYTATFVVASGLSLFFFAVSFFSPVNLNINALNIVYVLLLCLIMVFLTWIDLHYSWELSAYLIALLLLSTIL